MEALKRLINIYANHTTNARTANNNFQQTSSTPTTPAAIRKAPRVNGRTTRNNTPGLIPVTTEGAQADTTEGAEVEQEREYKTNWYDEPRQKRK
jgi:hypothetical protein